MLAEVPVCGEISGVSPQLPCFCMPTAALPTSKAALAVFCQSRNQNIPGSCVSLSWTATATSMALTETNLGVFVADR
jgi:hypothetical protein